MTDEERNWEWAKQQAGIAYELRRWAVLTQQEYWKRIDEIREKLGFEALERKKEL